MRAQRSNRAATAAIAGVLAAAAAGAGGCGGEGDGGADPDAAGDGGAGLDASACPRAPRPADGPRVAVISHPYDAAGGQASTYRLVALDAAGAATVTDTTFTMGRSTIGTIQFTPDGEVGVVAQSDGSLGVFRLDAGGAVSVVHARFAGSFYAEHVVMGPGGDVAYVIDPNWREHGGGVYVVAIGCDGTLTDRGRWFASKSPRGLHLAGDRALVAAADVDGALAGHELHLLDAGAAPPTRLAGADAFGDDDAIVGGTALTPDGRFALIGDTSQFSGVPNRVAVVERAGDALVARQVLSPLEDPLSIVASPFGDAALVVSGFGDHLIALDHAPAASPPFTVRGPLAYSGGRPELPGHAVVIERGALRGLVLVAENVGVRRVRFAAGGALTDLGKTSTGSGYQAIVGAIGVQP